MNEPKRKPKGQISFNIQLTQEQKDAKSLILQNTITVLSGKAGSGKSLLATQVGLDLLFRKEVEKLIICRPLVTSGEEIGILPGGIKEKLDPMLYSLYDSMNRLYNKAKIDKEIEDGHIEICPLAFARGRNFMNCFIIIDESQNMTLTQTYLMLSRICHGSKMVLCGDTSQIDLKDKKSSGFSFLRKLENIKEFSYIILKENHRHPIVESITEVYDEYKNS